MPIATSGSPVTPRDPTTLTTRRPIGAPADSAVLRRSVFDAYAELGAFDENSYITEWIFNEDAATPDELEAAAKRRVALRRPEPPIEEEFGVIGEEDLEGSEEKPLFGFLSRRRRRKETEKEEKKEKKIAAKEKENAKENGAAEKGTATATRKKATPRKRKGQPSHDSGYETDDPGYISASSPRTRKNFFKLGPKSKSDVDVTTASARKKKGSLSYVVGDGGADQQEYQHAHEASAETARAAPIIAKELVGTPTQEIPAKEKELKEPGTPKEKPKGRRRWSLFNTSSSRRNSFSFGRPTTADSGAAPATPVAAAVNGDNANAPGTSKATAADPAPANAENSKAPTQAEHSNEPSAEEGSGETANKTGHGAANAEQNKEGGEQEEWEQLSTADAKSMVEADPEEMKRRSKNIFLKGRRRLSMS